MSPVVHIPMRPYLVTYKGLWLGGKAVVMATNKEHAERLAKEHPSTIDFEKVSVDEIECEGDGACVLYNDNGDY